MLGVFAMAEIAMLLPHSGGTFVYLHRIYGKAVGYAYGWGSFACIQSASAAAIAYVFAESLNAVVTLPKLGPEWEAMTVLWIFTPFADLGVKLAGSHWRHQRESGPDPVAVGLGSLEVGFVRSHLATREPCWFSGFSQERTFIPIPTAPPIRRCARVP